MDEATKNKIKSAIRGKVSAGFDKGTVTVYGAKFEWFETRDAVALDFVDTPSVFGSSYTVLDSTGVKVATFFEDPNTGVIS